MRVSRVSRLSASCVILGSLQCAWLPSAQAQATGEEPSTQLVLEDVVVTARRVGESRLAVPAAVTSISTVELERYAAVDLESIAALALQVTVTRVPSSNGASFVIRGIGSSPFDAGLEQSVAVNIDGVQTSRGRIVNLGMFDVQQVEVLKGPQALFFGKNSPAGVISIVSADPTSVFESHIRVGYEFEADERYAEGMISGPLSETVRARLAVRASDMNGWLRNVVAPSPNPLAPDLPAPGSQRGRQPGNEEVLGRLTLEWSPTDSLQAKLKIAVGNGRANGESGVIEVMCTDGKTVPMEFGVPDTQNDCRLDGVKHVADLSPVVAATMPYVNGGVPFSRDRTTLSTLTINYDRGDLSLTSVTGYARLNAKYADNYNYSSFGSVFAGETELSRTWSQELRLVSSFDHPLNFTAGLYYESGRRHAASASYLGVLGGLPDLATGN